MCWSASQILLNTATFKIFFLIPQHSLVFISSVLLQAKRTVHANPRLQLSTTKLLPPLPGDIWISILELQTITLEEGWIWHMDIELCAVILLNKIKFPSGINMAYYTFDYVSQHFTYSSNKIILKCPQWSAKYIKQWRISQNEAQVKEKSWTNFSPSGEKLKKFQCLILTIFQSLYLLSPCSSCLSQNSSKTS